jgi:hypothetical protein
MTLGGHPVTVVPLGPPGSRGQTLYDVQWRGVTVQTAFTGQIGPAQLANGSPLKRQLEGAYRANQAAVPRTVQMTLGGHPVTVVPLVTPGSRGQTLYDVQCRGL